MTDDESVQLREVMEEVLDQRARVDLKTHHEHHEFVEMLIEDHKIKKERWETIQRQFLGWGVIALAGWLGKVVIEALGMKIG